jgi:hypothetical protein
MSFHYSSSGATLFRAFYIHDLTATVNFARKFEIRPFIKIYTNIRLDRVAYPITCSTIELGTGIIFASVPSLKPFMQFFTSTEKKFDTSYNQSGRDAERTGTGHYYTMEVLKSTAGPSTNEDEEDLIRDKAAIVVSSQYVVQHDNTRN